jgi:hypothetical protein
LECAGSQKERKIEKILEEECFRLSSQMRRKLERGWNVGGRQMQMLYKLCVLLMKRGLYYFYVSYLKFSRLFDLHPIPRLHFSHRCYIMNTFRTNDSLKIVIYLPKFWLCLQFPFESSLHLSTKQIRTSLTILWTCVD